MYSKALTFVPAIIFWLILAAILVARLSLAESPTKRDRCIEFSYQAKMTAKAWENVSEGLDTETTMATKNGKKCTGTTVLLVIFGLFSPPDRLKVRLE